MAKETIQLEVYEGVDGRRHYTAAVERTLVDHYGLHIIQSVAGLIAQKIAEDFVREHGAEIIAKLDQNAIANLAIAQSGAAIRETLEKPIKLEHKVKLW